MRHQIAILVLMLGCKPHEPTAAEKESDFQRRMKEWADRQPQPDDLSVSDVISEDYQGPLGLYWGMTRRQTKEFLRGQFTFKEERERDYGKTIEQSYRGTFADYRSDDIVAAFRDEQLVGMTVQLPTEDDRPASLRWSDLVAATIRSHGKPSKLIQAPSNDASRLDRMIQRGDWVPAATWMFSNHSVIGISVITGDPNKHGTRHLTVVWCALRDIHVFDGYSNEKQKL